MHQTQWLISTQVGAAVASAGDDWQYQVLPYVDGPLKALMTRCARMPKSITPGVEDVGFACGISL